MCREGAWAELAAEVTFMMGIQSRMPGFKTFKRDLDRSGSRFFWNFYTKNITYAPVLPINYLRPQKGAISV